MNGTAMASSAVIMADANWSATHVGDFNGDGKADLAWRNAATGQTAIWLMNGTAPSSSAVVLSVSQWSVVGTPDMALMVSDALIVFDHLSHEVTIMVNAFVADPPSADAAYELWVAGSTTSSSRRSQRAARP